MTIAVSAAEAVPIDSLTPYPGNARRGDVAVIAESLQVLGQYRPIVANRRTGEILRGNHTWRAARGLGWDTISVAWVDVDPAAARRIVLADNRIHDLGTDDTRALLNLLGPLPDLLGTGYTENDVLLMQAADQADEDKPRSGGGGDADGPVNITVGPYRMVVARDAWEPWSLTLLDGRDSDDVIPELRRRLWLPADETPAPRAPRKMGRKMPARSPARFTLTDTRTAAVTSLRLYPGNARQGDIGAIATSLATHGQYSPLVVRRSDQTVLVGNHTLQAAIALGWAEVVITEVDVDDTAAAKIVAADNRTASLGHYDNDALLRLLLDAGDLDGTGYDGDDLDDLLAAANRTPVTSDAKHTPIKIGPWSTSATPSEWEHWHAATVDAVGADPAAVCDAIIAALNLPDGCWEQP